MSTTYRLIGQDCACSIYDGGVFGGTPSYGAEIPVQAFAKSISLKEEMGTRDMRGLGDTTKRLRPAQDSGFSVELKLLIGSGGAVAVTTGHYAKVVFKSLSSFSPGTYIGIVTSQSIEAPDGEQVQTLVLEGPADMSVA